MSSSGWSGRVAVHFHLDGNEVAAASAPPPPLIRLLPRHAYLPVVAEAALELHRDLLPPGEDATWFSFNGVPMKWQIPVGVLFDLVVAGREMPWMLLVHHRFFPSSVLLPMTDPIAGATGGDTAGANAGEEDRRAGMGSDEGDSTWLGGRSPEKHGAAMRAIRRQWLSSLKEALFVLNGSAGANSVMEMEEEHADAMFAAIETGNWERFSIALSATNINMGNVVMRPHTTKLQERLSDQLPVRMCMIDVSPEGSGANADIGQSAPAVLGASRTDIRDWGSFEYSSGPIGVVMTHHSEPPESPSAGMELTTIKDLLLQWSQRSGLECDHAPSGDVKETEAGREKDDWRVAGEDEPVLHGGIFRERLAQVIVGGIEVPLSSTIVSLYDALRSPDAFLYVVIRLIRTE